MAELLVLEFSTADAAAIYKKVSGILGVDPATGKGDWPEGLLTHVAGVSGTDALVVVETWESKEAQEKLLADRLGAALGQAGAPQPSRMQWFTLEGEKR